MSSAVPQNVGRLRDDAASGVATGLALCLVLGGGCAGAGDERGDAPRRPLLSDQDQDTLKAGKDFFPVYVKALERFGSPRPSDWDEGEKLLDQAGTLYAHPLEREARRRLHADSPEERAAARAELARRGRVYRCWMELQPSKKDYASGDEKELAAARSAYYARLIETRQKMLALGDDAVDLLIDTYVTWLARASPNEQMILRDELEACGSRVVPVLTALLALPPRKEGENEVWDMPLRVQAMLVLTRFVGDPNALAAIGRLSTQAPAVIRKLAATSLRETHKGSRRDDVGTLLIAMLRDDPSWEVRGAAAQALGDLGNAKACEPLLEALRRPSSGAEEDRTSVAKFVVWALGRLRCREAVAPLVDLIDRMPQIQRHTLQALHGITGQYYATSREWRRWMSDAAPPPTPPVPRKP